MRQVNANKTVKFACAKNAHAWTTLTLRHLPQRRAKNKKQWKMYNLKNGKYGLKKYYVYHIMLYLLLASLC